MLLECSWAPLSYALWIMAKLLCSCLLCLMQLLSYMLWMKKMFNGFLIKKGTWILHVMKAQSIHHMCNLYYAVEAFITLN